MRSEAEGIMESVREVINIAQQAEVNIKISHLKIRGQGNWPRLEELLTELENGWHRGAQVRFDVYPYTSTWQPLYAYLPAWAIDGGRQHLLKQLGDPVQHNKILTHLNNAETSIKSLVIASTSAGLHATGKTVGQMAADWGTSSEQAVLTLIKNGGSEVLVFDECLEEAGMWSLASHALGLVASDGGGFPIDVKQKLVHPRCFGAAPRFLRHVLDHKNIPLSEAVRKLTSAPAAAMGLQGRGIIKAHNFADLVMFDETKIRDCATLTNPFQFSEGLDAVWINGTLSVRQNRLTQQTAGIFLKHY
jgi:N-acyl-D-amino-acid deacylase